jgi:hypothetical protein
MLNTHSIYWPEAFGKSADFVGYNRAVKQIYRCIGDAATDNVTDQSECRLYCNIPLHHNPKELKKTGLPLIAYTMFESTQMPKAWVNFLNNHVDGIIVPTQFCFDVFRLSGVTKPIKIATLGIDKNEFNYMPPVEHDGFNFYWQGHHYDPNGRKGAGVVEQAFRNLKSIGAFDNSVRLYLKYRPHENFDIKLDNIEAEPGIFHISETLSKEEMHNLLSKMDCCVNPSRGEGFGYIPLEQMAMGKPVILTNWSFPYLDPNWCVPINYELTKSPTNWCYKHFAITPIGIEYNFGKGLKVHHWPKRIERVSNGCKEFGVNGWTDVPKTLRGTIHNFIADLHEKSGLYRNIGKDFRYGFNLESTGYDASCSVDHLMQKMLYVYKTIDWWRDRGDRISYYARNNWDFNRVRNEFTRAIGEFKQEGVI